MDYAERLRQEIETGRAIVVLGTGISKALSGNAPLADWVGLLRDGLGHAESTAIADGETVALQQMMLDHALASDSPQQLLGVASWLSKTIRDSSDQAFADWLRDSVGSLPLAGPIGLALALKALGLPIATTNYDNLMGQALNWGATQWQDSETVRQVFRGEQVDRVVHLHGIWDNPQSVILSELDYGRIVSSPAAVANLNSFYHSHSFIFVGYGKGLDDPNFGMMLAHHRNISSESRGDHFRLCLSSEVDELTALHLADDIRVVPYGDDYGALVGFVESMAPTTRQHGMVLRDRVSFAVERLRSQLVSDALHTPNVAVHDGAALSKYLVPPVLLTAPHERFVQEKQVDGEVAAAMESRRVEPTDVARDDQVVVLSGRELSGVSTTIRWLLNEAVLARPHAGPIYVDFNSLTPGSSPLSRAIRKEALNARLIDTIGDDLPEFVLAIDNVRPRNDKIYENFLREINDCTAKFVVLGCRESDGPEVWEGVSSTSRLVQPLYLGRLGIDEVASLASLIVPMASPTLCSRVLQIVRNEHLPRSPFTITLLLVLVAKESINLANSSETSVLDAYASYLLGRTGPFLDPRWTLGVQNRETVLADVAKLFVRERAGSLSAPIVEAEIIGIFDRLDWPDDAGATLNVFCQLKLLSRQNSQIKFQQSSYLHLFAAKAAIRDEAFRDELLADPLYFAPIIRHYAALTRNSTVVLNAAETLVGGFPEPGGDSRIFSQTERFEFLGDGDDDEEGHATGEDDLTVQTPVAAEAGGAGDEAAKGCGEGSGPVPIVLPKSLAYDPSPDDDRLPFPLTDPQAWSEASRLAWTLDLASRALRDSDDIQELAAKDRLFRLILQRWGFLLKRFEVDKLFNEGALKAAESDGYEGDQLELISEYFELLIPSLLVFSGISACLASTKLERANARALTDPEISADPFSCFASAMFAYASKSKSWTEQWVTTAKDFGDLWVVNTFMLAIGISAYKYEVMHDEDLARLRIFFGHCLSGRGTYVSDASRQRQVAKFTQSLTKMRVLNEKKRLPDGQRALN
ncbi:hypothetical protein C3B61_13260 [Cryobacterium zongtaii]|uniref:Uncharacterized protein n=1 Tax=Cryobacterium zongtaii TaxID=1259217 RepID=A0A2S3ZDF9_9MICO|nr:SIR2 family protein [Cryobacterium zongtaii]POH64409.1 hypothetical protein C3B61_13260 [Cryobacterium zongtaii]